MTAEQETQLREVMRRLRANEISENYAFSRAEYDDGTFVCPDCGEREDDANMAVECFERFDTILCDLCFEARCEREEDEE